jgi:DNA polymerase
MNGKDDAAALLDSMRSYLVELQETGVDELPVAVSAAVSPEERDILLGPAPVEDRPAGVVETLDEIRADMGECLRCPLGEKRSNLVFGTGDPKARLLFVGEAPGRDEDIKGEPFVGEAGMLLTKIIQAMGLQRSQVYICNVLKCRPPNNRNPLPSEIDKCHPFMLRQVRAIAPEVIVALGTFAVQTLLESKEPISKLRGRFHDYHGIPLMPTFHPAFLLRNQNMKREVWEDMQQVMKKLGLEAPKVSR